MINKNNVEQETTMMRSSDLSLLYEYLGFGDENNGVNIRIYFSW